MFFKNQRGEAMRECRRDGASSPSTTGDAAVQNMRGVEVSLEGDEAEEVALKLAGL